MFRPEQLLTTEYIRGFCGGQIRQRVERICLLTIFLVSAPPMPPFLGR